ncbi:monoglyceride lipase-like [Bolinopsis microptera]|uniref:monoglyceride lipase-like n=1 Tax=Bolinopsis microptera TaxID=2820187 RepID=UPI003079F8CE
MGSLLDNSLQIISNTTGKSLFVRLWPLSTAPKGIVYIVHELGGHCLLYDVIAARFLEAGYTVASHDQYGHGLSSGTRLHTSNYQTYVADTLQCLEEVKCQYQDTDNVLLFGHGVGGLLAALLAAQNPGFVKGLILHGPIFKFLEEHASTVNVCWYLSYVLPLAYSPVNGTDPALLITDKDQRMKYARDPFIWHEGPRLSTIHAVTTAMGDLEQVEEPLSCPTLIQCGQDDQLLNKTNLTAWSKRCSKTTKLLFYEGAKHYLHMDTPECTIKVLDEMVKFCDVVRSEAASDTDDAVGSEAASDTDDAVGSEAASDTDDAVGSEAGSDTADD